MPWYDTLISLCDFSHPALKEAGALLEAGDREGCARRVIEHFRTRTSPAYLFTAEDLRKNPDPHLIEDA